MHFSLRATQCALQLGKQIGNDLQKIKEWPVIITVETFKKLNIKYTVYTHNSDSIRVLVGNGEWHV